MNDGLQCELDVSLRIFLAYTLKLCNGSFKRFNISLTYELFMKTAGSDDVWIYLAILAKKYDRPGYRLLLSHRV